MSPFRRSFEGDSIVWLESQPCPDGAQPDPGRGLREVLVSETVKESLCSGRIPDTELPPESHLWLTA